MGNVVKMQKDKFKKLVEKQDEIARPDTLGEPTNVTNWINHINAGNNLKSFCRIQDTKDGKKQAVVNTPGPNQTLKAVKETFCDHYYIWILCLNSTTGQIQWRVNAGDIDFVVWDEPKELTEEEFKEII